MYMRERFHDVLPQADDVLFDITSVARWFYMDSERENTNWQNLPMSVPPYPVMWMEFHEPSQVFMDGALQHNVLFAGGQRGCGIQTRGLPDYVQEYYAGDAYSLVCHGLEHALGPYFDSNKAWSQVDDENENNPRWLVDATVYQANRDTVASVLFASLALDNKGQCMAHAIHAHEAGCNELVLNPTRLTNEEKQHWKGRMHSVANALSMPFFFSLALLNCRNVKTVDVPPQPAPILKQRAKKGIPYIQYKTLEVTPLRTVRQGGTRKDGTPEPKALHFVRGHFKDFSDKGLFGKYKGVYWWDSQVRGDVAKGIVDKDYRVSHD